VPVEAEKTSDPTKPEARRSSDPRFRFPRAQGKQSSSEFGDGNIERASRPPDSLYESGSPESPSGSPEGSPSPSSSDSPSGTPPAPEFGL